MPLPGWHSLRELLAFIFRSTKRIVVLVVGLALMAGGVAMLVLPGPGIVVMIAGLAVLATEFTWAEAMLDRAQAQAGKVKDSAARGWQRWRRREQRLDP